MGKLDLHFFTPDFAEVNVRYYKGIMKSCQRQSLALSILGTCQSLARQYFK